MKGVNMPENEGQQLSPFDTSAQQQELDAINAELEQARASIEGDFAKFASENTTPEMEELFFENKEQFYLQILQMQNDFLESGVGAKEQRAAELTADINQKQQMGAIEQAEMAFLQKHPEVNTDELLDFFKNDLPPRQQAELEKLPPEQFFEALFELKGGEQAPQQEEQASGEDEKLPQQLNGVASSEAGQGRVSDLPFRRL